MEKEPFYALCQRFGYKQDVVNKLAEAVDFADKNLAGKKRLAGDTYLCHNLRVGSILIENRSEPEIIMTAILHGMEYHDDLEETFGKEICQLVQEVKELQRIKSKNTQVEAEALRRILLTALKDVRVILVKLANKLDNLKTIQVFHPDEQKRLAEEVLEVYAPLAYRLGVDKIRTQLEDVAFQIINPKKYNEISSFLEESREEREKRVEEAIDLINNLVEDKVEISKIKGRPKQIYSIHKKIQNKGVRLQQLFDLIGIRAVVPEIKDCYALLGVLHEKLEPIDGRLKDYIANPKPNFYRSLHTGVKLPNGKIAEVQIRTPEMDEFAEEGLASHWRYKGMKSDQLFEKKISWLKEVLEMQKNIENKDFLDTVKVDLFGDKIYCYTPKGHVKELPLGATLLDFAFMVHEEIGSRCVGGRVNGKFVPIKHKISSGDVIEILTNKNQRPRRSWIKIVTSSKARQKIRKSLNEHEKLPAFHFRLFNPISKEEQGLLAECPLFPKAISVLAKCCRAIPGDNIVGIPTKRRVISVHKEECRVARKEEKRLVTVEWKDAFSQKIKFYVEAAERSGLLADLLHTIATAGFEVKEAKAKLLGSDAQCSFKVIPRNLNHLKELVKRVGKVKGMKKIYFD